MQTKISIIIPVYNIESYLRDCLNSVLAQTFKDFDVVLIDDGSTDGSGAICDEYADTDDRITVIHQTNKGLALARNIGLDWMFQNSKSQWVCFVDSDDQLHPQALSIMYKLASESDHKLISCRYSRDVKSLDTVYCSEILPTKLESPEDYYCDYKEKRRTETVVWAKLFERSLFETMRFPEVRAHEDAFVTYKILFSQQKILCVDLALYYHSSNPNGIIRSEWSPRRMAAFDALSERIDFFDKKGFLKAKEKAVITYGDTLSQYIKNVTVRKKYPKEKKKMQKMLKEHISKYKKNVSNKTRHKWLYAVYVGNRKLEKLLTNPGSTIRRFGKKCATNYR